jgi:HK97 family phage prohead protease
MSQPLKIQLLNGFGAKIAGHVGTDAAVSLADGTTAEPKENIMEGYATVFDQKTDLYFYTLSIDKGAFRKSIEERADIVSLLNHDWNYLLGRTPDTLELDDSHSYGLWTKTRLPNHDLGRRIAEDITRKALTQMSVTFYVQREEYTSGTKDSKPHVHVMEAHLEDVSCVVFGQYPQTTLKVREAQLSAFASKHGSAAVSESEIAAAHKLLQAQHDQRKRGTRGIDD